MIDPVLFNQIVFLERRLHEPEIRADSQELDNLLADSFREFGASGKVYSKQEIVDSLLSNPGLKLDVENEVVTAIAPTVCLVTYTSVKTIDNEICRTNRSSIWKLYNKSWKIIFHQGTKNEKCET